MSRPRVEIVVARADNGAIGKDGRLPWHLPADLRHFKAVTMGAPMIMGRKTFDSLPGLLPGREHIVLTRDPDWRAQGVTVAGSRDEALDLAAGERVCVIGGAQIYREFLPIADRIHLTEVHISPEGDTFFPPIDEADWQAERASRQPADGDRPAYTFVQLERR